MSRRERAPPRVIKRNDQVDAAQRDIEPAAIGGVQYPLLTRADLLDPAPLFVSRDRDPARFPGQVVYRSARAGRSAAATFAASVVLPDPVTP